MRQALSQDGFTLVELMVVVSIIAIMAAGIAPAISGAMADGRAGNAAVDLVRLGGRARSETAFTGLAHVLSYTPGAGLGQVWLFRGVNNRCNMQTWNLVDGPQIDAVDMASYNLGPTQEITLFSPTAIFPTAGIQTPIDICYQPDGLMLIRNQGQLNFTPPANNGVGFTIIRLVGGVEQGVRRQVFFPYGGVARIP